MIVAASTKVEDFVRRFKKEFSLFSLTSSAGSNGVVQNGSWYIDSGVSLHMIEIWHIFPIIYENGTRQFVRLEGGQERIVRRIGNFRF